MLRVESLAVMQAVGLLGASRQQAEAVVLVTRPICPRTALICLRVQRAMCGWSARIASWSHWPDQQRHKGGLIKGGEKHLDLPTQSMGPGGSRLTARLWSMEPSVRAAVVLGHLHRTWACDPNL